MRDVWLVWLSRIPTTPSLRSSNGSKDFPPLYASQTLILIHIALIALHVPYTLQDVVHRTVHCGLPYLLDRNGVGGIRKVMVFLMQIPNVSGLIDQSRRILSQLSSQSIIISTLDTPQFIRRILKELDLGEDLYIFVKRVLHMINSHRKFKSKMFRLNTSASGHGIVSAAICLIITKLYPRIEIVEPRRLELVNTGHMDDIMALLKTAARLGDGYESKFRQGRMVDTFLSFISPSLEVPTAPSNSSTPIKQVESRGDLHGLIASYEDDEDGYVHPAFAANIFKVVHITGHAIEEIMACVKIIEDMLSDSL